MHKKYLSSVVLVVCLPISLQHCAPDLSVMQEEPSQVERQSLKQVASALQVEDLHTRLTAVASLVSLLESGSKPIFTKGAAVPEHVPGCRADETVSPNRTIPEGKPTKKRVRDCDEIQYGSLQDVLSIIVTALEDVYPVVRQTAAKALIALLETGVNPQDVLPLVQKTFEDEDPDVLQMARKALGVIAEKVDTEQSIDKLLRIDRQLLQAIEENSLSQVQAIVSDDLVLKLVYQPNLLLHLALREAGEEKIAIAQYIVRQAKCAMKRLPERDFVNMYRHSLEMAIVLEVPGLLKVLLEEVPEHMYQEPDEEDGSNLLHFAACAGATSCVQLLVEEKRLSVVAQDHEGGLPLHYAATKGNVECMLYLIEQMQCIGRRDLLNATGGKFGFTPLHCLVASEEVEDDEANLELVVSALEGNKSLKDYRQRTPRDLALSMSEVVVDIDLL